MCKCKCNCKLDWKIVDGICLRCRNLWWSVHGEKYVGRDCSYDSNLGCPQSTERRPNGSIDVMSSCGNKGVCQGGYDRGSI